MDKFNFTLGFISFSAEGTIAVTLAVILAAFLIGGIVASRHGLPALLSPRTPKKLADESDE